MTENGICLDGRLRQIRRGYRLRLRRSNFMKPWRNPAAVTPSDVSAASACASYRHERVSKAKAGVLYSEVHQDVRPLFRIVVPDSGEQIAVTRRFGGSRAQGEVVGKVHKFTVDSSQWCLERNCQL